MNSPLQCARQAGRTDAHAYSHSRTHTRTHSLSPPTSPLLPHLHLNAHHLPTPRHFCLAQVLGKIESMGVKSRFVELRENRQREERERRENKVCLFMCTCRRSGGRQEEEEEERGGFCKSKRVNEAARSRQAGGERGEERGRERREKRKERTGCTGKCAGTIFEQHIRCIIYGSCSCCLSRALA